MPAIALAGRLSQSLRAYSTRARATGHGQNLSERYARLENSIRGKQALKTGMDALALSGETDTQSGMARTVNPALVKTFRGLAIPEKPKAPESDECCMSGCAICVYDLYEESMETYKEKLVDFRAQLTTMGVPETEWPASVAGNSETTTTNKNVTLSVFEEMERALKLRQNPQHKYARPAASLPPPGNVKDSFTELKEGIRWILFSNR